MKNHSKTIPNPQFNHRLKDIFMTAARNSVLFNPDAHLSGYFWNLLHKKGMKANEAYKRVAQALVRMVFKMLRALVEEGSEEEERSESDMASGSDFRSDISHESNISLSAPIEDDIEEKRKIKREKIKIKHEEILLVEKK